MIKLRAKTSLPDSGLRDFGFEDMRASLLARLLETTMLELCLFPAGSWRGWRLCSHSMVHHRFGTEVA